MRPARQGCPACVVFRALPECCAVRLNQLDGIRKDALPRGPSGKLSAMPAEVIVYSRKGCHLCEIVKETLSKLARNANFNWREIDVDSDELLRRRFTDEVPVVFINGRKAFKYRLNERDFLRKLAR